MLVWCVVFWGVFLCVWLVGWLVDWYVFGCACLFVLHARRQANGEAGRQGGEEARTSKAAWKSPRMRWMRAAIPFSSSAHSCWSGVEWSGVDCGISLYIYECINLTQRPVHPSLPFPSSVRTWRRAGSVRMAPATLA